MRFALLPLLLFSLLQSYTTNASEKHAWFTSTGAGVGRHLFLLQAAIESVLSCCSDGLFPVILFEGPVESAPPWLRLLHDNSLVLVVPHRLTWYENLTENHKRISASYSRMEIPSIMHKVVEKYPNVNPQYVLYTDCDALFIKMPPILKPALLAIGPELVKGHKDNSGVMFINNYGLLPHVPDYIEHARKNGHRPDQLVTLDMFQNRSELLPDIYNWKPYWGVNPDALIWHTHGTKFSECVEDYLIFRYESGHDNGRKTTCKAQVLSAVSRQVQKLYSLTFEDQMVGYAKYSVDFYTAIHKLNERLMKLTKGKPVHSYYSKKRE